MAKFIRHGTSAALQDRLVRALQSARWSLAMASVIWVVLVAGLVRLDLAVVDFLGHTKDLSQIHGAVADSPATFVTPEGSTIDAASLQDLHDEDTVLLHGARNHLIAALAWVFLVPIAIAGLLVWLPRGRPVTRKPRAK